MIEKRFGDVRLTTFDDGRVNVQYGGLRGSETFSCPEDAQAELTEWTELRLNEIEKDLAAIMKLRRYLRR